ncbi:MAG TPA: twin-arginine translocation signal domain-containing protein, partial [Solirubrobacteraceae bacterium]|nr:twin-arginine translocation signal domain-containing protein [Solirubrobacteraceae bacterium]
MSRSTYSRRAVLRAGALGAVALAAGGAAWPQEAEAEVTQETPLPQGRYTLDGDWMFGGVYAAGSEQPGYSEAGFQTVCLPHTVTPLSWGYWDPATWEQQWIYRKHISQAAVSGGRVFVDFQGVMTTAT